MNTHKWSCKITQWWWRVLHYFMCASYCVCSSVQLITCTVSGTKLYVRRPSTSTCHVMTAAHVHARYVQPCIAWHVRMRLWPHQSDMHAHMHAWHDMHSTTHGNMHVNMLACTCACACCADLHVAWMNGQKWTNDYTMKSAYDTMRAHKSRFYFIAFSHCFHWWKLNDHTLGFHSIQC